MSPSEKAKELFMKFSSHTVHFNCARSCALIAVNEIIDAIDWHEYETPNKELNYWLDIRKEIEKLNYDNIK